MSEKAGGDAGKTGNGENPANPGEWDATEAYEYEAEREPHGAALLGWWVLATTASWALAGVLMAVVLPNPGSLWQYAFYPLVGVAQWLVLRRRFARASLWILATAAGVAVAVAGAAVIFWLPVAALGPATSPQRGALSTVLDGLAIGVAQWLVLRLTVREAERWIPVAAVAHWALALLYLASSGVEAPPVAELSRGEIVSAVAQQLGLLGLLSGLATGTLLIRLVQQPRQPRLPRSEQVP